MKYVPGSSVAAILASRPPPLLSLREIDRPVLFSMNRYESNSVLRMMALKIVDLATVSV